MALKLRKAIFRKAFMHSALAFGVGILLTAIFAQFSGAGFVWLFLLSASIVLASAGIQFVRLASRLQPEKNGLISYQEVVPEKLDDGMVNGVDIDWQAMRECGQQLRNLGYSHLGDFCITPPMLNGPVAVACYLDAAAAILVEVQFIQLFSEDAHAVLNEGVHFSIVSLLGGNIRVCCSDQQPTGRHFLLRGQNEVMVFYPKLKLANLLEKHRRMLSNVQKRTNKLVSTGLNIERHVLLLRERMAYASKRVARMGGFAIAQEIDTFESHPQYKWAPPSSQLAALPVRVLEDFDQTELARQQDLLLPSSSDAA